MSIQAVGWALEQELPARPKLVLVSIANHANHANHTNLHEQDAFRDDSCRFVVIFLYFLAI